MANYTSIEDIVSGVSNATQLRTNNKQDDGTDTVTGVDWFSYGGTVCNNIYANGNGWIGFGSSSEHLKVNRRDQAMWNLWREEGTFSTLFNSYRFLRIRWNGYAHYSVTSDSAKLTFDVLLFDTGDIMLYFVDIPTEYYDGTFSLGSLTYDKPTTDKRYVTFYKQSDETYIVDYAPISYNVKKYLVRNNGMLYTVSDGALVEVTGTLNADLFINNGSDTIPDGALLMTLSAPEVLCWSDSSKVPVMNATLTATPQKQNIITNTIDLSNPTILGIESAVATCEGDLIIAVSFDNKQTWKAWNGSEWATLSDDFSGMSKEMLESLTLAQWNELYEGADSLYLRVSLVNTNQSIEQIYFDFAN